MFHLVRSELHRPQVNDYMRLHAFMAQEGLNRTIVAANGVEYALPTGTYFANSYANTATVLQAAKRAADRTGRTNEVIVTSTNEPLRWDGLKPV